MTVKRQCIPRNGKTIREIAEKPVFQPIRSSAGLLNPERSILPVLMKSVSTFKSYATKD